MTNKEYKIVQMFIAAIIAAVASFGVATGNFTITITVVGVGILALLALKKEVKEVTHDERDLANAGRAARYAVLAYATAASAIALWLFFARAQNPSFEAVASTLAYSACTLMLLQGIMFDLVSNRVDPRRGWRAFTLAVIMAALLGIVTMRFFVGEDGWICNDGQWVQHGHPNFPAPTDECPTK